MKLFIRIGLLLIFAAPNTVWAQNVATVEQQIESLRAQLRDVADREAQLQERSRQLDEDLRPENIQRSVAGIGTTDAESLRAQRRQQLERQKAAVEEQLASLANSRSRLEAAISSAEAEAVRLRAAALGAANAPSPAETTTTRRPPAAVKSRQSAPRTTRRAKRSKAKRRVRTR